MPKTHLHFSEFLPLKKLIHKKELFFTNGRDVWLHRRTSDNSFFIAGYKMPYSSGNCFWFFNKDSLRSESPWLKIEAERQRIAFFYPESQYDAARIFATAAECCGKQIGNGTIGQAYVPDSATEWQTERCEEALGDFGIAAQHPFHTSGCFESDLTDTQKRLLRYSREPLERVFGKPKHTTYEQMGGIADACCEYTNGMMGICIAIPE